MKTLTHYTKSGYHYTLLIRQGNFAIFQGVHKSVKAPTFEVIEIQSHNGMEIAGYKIDPSEYPPASSQWGSKGFTYKTYDEALVKFNQLTQ